MVSESRQRETQRFSKIAELVGLEAEPKSLQDCKVAFLDARCSRYLQQHKDLMDEVCGEFLGKVYIFLGENVGKFRDYVFLAKYVLKYSQKIYIFALDGALRNASNLEELYEIEECYYLPKNFRAGETPIKGFWEKIRLWRSKVLKAKMWQDEYLRTGWEELGRVMNSRIKSLQAQLEQHS